MKTTNSYIRLSKLLELREHIESVRSQINDEAVYRPLNRAMAIIDVYLMPHVEVKVEIEDDTAQRHEEHINHMRQVAHENT